MSGLKTLGYSLEFKLKVVEEYMSGNISKDALSRKYGIKGHSTITKWLRKLNYNYKMEASNDKDYKKRIKELEEMLELERMKRKSAEVIIELAEQQLKIDIRKKFDTKQLKK